MFSKVTSQLFIQGVQIMFLRVSPNCTAHTPHSSQYAAITLATSCTASTYLLLTKCVIFSYVLAVAPWWWFPCKRNTLEQFYLF